MIEIGRELFSLNRMEDKEAQGNEWFIRSGQNPCLVYHKPRTRHQLHRLGWAPRLNGLLTATGQRHQKVETCRGSHLQMPSDQRNLLDTHTRMLCLFSICCQRESEFWIQCSKKQKRPIFKMSAYRPSSTLEEWHFIKCWNATSSPLSSSERFIKAS